MKTVFLLATFLVATQAREDLVQQLTAGATNRLMSARSAADAEVLEDNTIADLSDLTDQINEIGLLLAKNDDDKDGSGDDDANFLLHESGKPIKPSKKPGKGSKKSGKGSKKPGKGSKKKPEPVETSSDRFISAEQPELGPEDLEALPLSLRRYIQALEDRELMRKREEHEKAAEAAELRSLLQRLTSKRQN
ncbi:uncharacterized protein LOC144867047 [Branchiostoma floridae x Branchiostoma japonicum]